MFCMYNMYKKLSIVALQLFVFLSYHVFAMIKDDKIHDKITNTKEDIAKVVNGDFVKYCKILEKAIDPINGTWLIRKKEKPQDDSQIDTTESEINIDDYPNYAIFSISYVHFIVLLNGEAAQLKDNIYLFIEISESMKVNDKYCLLDLFKQSFRKNSMTSFRYVCGNTKLITSIYEMFVDCEKLETVNLKGMNTSNCESFYGLFKNCHSLKFVNLSDCDMSQGNNFQEMFFDCEQIRKIRFGILPDNKQIDRMFGFCNSQKKYKYLNELIFMTGDKKKNTIQYVIDDANKNIMQKCFLCPCIKNEVESAYIS